MTTTHTSVTDAEVEAAVNVMFRYSGCTPKEKARVILEQFAQSRQPSSEPQPIDMVLHCHACGMQHVDAPDVHDLGNPDEGTTFKIGWHNPPHRSHLCQGCGHVWRPADVPTNRVAAIKTAGKSDSPIVHPRPSSEAVELPPLPEPVAKLGVTAAGWAQVIVHGVVISSYYANDEAAQAIVDEVNNAAAIKAAHPQPAASAGPIEQAKTTGWPAGMLQDDCKGLSKWLSNKLDARQHVRDAADGIGYTADPELADKRAREEAPNTIARLVAAAPVVSHELHTNPVVSHISPEVSDKPAAPVGGQGEVSRAEIIRIAQKAGFKASIGRTDKDGKYHPNVNALSKEIPVEWLERFAALIRATPAPTQADAKDANGWCQYIAGMLECYLQTNPPADGREAAIAGIIERRLHRFPAFSQIAPSVDTRPICGNCDTPFPPGCKGLFKDDGDICLAAIAAMSAKGE